MSKFAAPHFQSHEAAREWFEAQRWPNGPVCPHCGEIDRSYATKRPGRYRCGEPACRKDFTVTTGHRHGAQPHPAAQVADGLLPHGVQQEGRQRAPAPPLARHRLRGGVVHGAPHPRGDARRRAVPPMGGEGNDRRGRRDLLRQAGRAARAQDEALLPGRPRAARSARPASAPSSRWSSAAAPSAPSTSPSPTTRRCSKIVTENVARESRLHTDESKLYVEPRTHFAAARDGEAQRQGVRSTCAATCHTNSRRGLLLDLQARDARHLPALPREAPAPLPRRVRLPLQPPGQARATTTCERTAAAVRGAAGKRLTYQQPHGA